MSSRRERGTRIRQLGRKIEIILDELDLSPNEFADAIGLSWSTINNWRKTKEYGAMHTSTAIKLARFIGSSPDFFAESSAEELRSFLHDASENSETHFTMEFPGIPPLSHVLPEHDKVYLRSLNGEYVACYVLKEPGTNNDSELFISKEFIEIGEFNEDSGMCPVKMPHNFPSGGMSAVGWLSFFRGKIYMVLFFQGHSYPPSSYILHQIRSPKFENVLFGLNLDVLEYNLDPFSAKILLIRKNLCRNQKTKIGKADNGFRELFDILGCSSDADRIDGKLRGTFSDEVVGKIFHVLGNDQNGPQ